MSGKDYYELSCRYHSGKMSAEDVVKRLVKQNDFDSARKKIEDSAKKIVKKSIVIKA